MTKIIISDTSCIIAFDRIQRLQILQKTFTYILITKEVQTEFGRPLPDWFSIAEPVNQTKKKELEILLDKGEASAITLALENPNCLLIIDEKKGRKVARELGIHIIGTLKILLIAKERGVISDIKSILKELESNNFRFSKEIMDQVLRVAKEV